jgi:coenzyme PQQ precursor peptide PqqA
VQAAAYQPLRGGPVGGIGGGIDFAWHGCGCVNASLRGTQSSFMPLIKETSMQWTAPAFTDLRFGFEITMYIANR